LRERGDGQLAVGDRAGEEDRGHHQRGRDRPQDEWPRRVHVRGLFAAPSASGARTCTVAPARSLSTPSTTTTSLAASPDSTDTSAPVVGPIATGRTSTVWSGFTT